MSFLESQTSRTLRSLREDRICVVRSLRDRGDQDHRRAPMRVIARVAAARVSAAAPKSEETVW